MPITLQDIKEHNEHYGTGDINVMDIAEYKQLLKDGAFFWINHNEAVRHTFSEEFIATSPAQIDALIELLQEFRQKMVDAGK